MLIIKTQHNQTGHDVYRWFFLNTMNYFKYLWIQFKVMNCKAKQIAMYKNCVQNETRWQSHSYFTHCCIYSPISRYSQSTCRTLVMLICVRTNMNNIYNMTLYTWINDFIWSKRKINTRGYFLEAGHIIVLTAHITGYHESRIKGNMQDGQIRIYNIIYNVKVHCKRIKLPFHTQGIHVKQKY